ncbi:MAG TPA: hypothetical protein VL614_07560 [Acetobacteraceae bacterium]|jgi:hypothetical protein|nr:hypothetical protein [Acetobacteraceae bacterium]
MTSAELLARADELRRMAEQASTPDIREALQRLSRRYEQLARERERDGH